MIREDDMGAFAHSDGIIGMSRKNSGSLKRFHFLKEYDWIKYYAVCDQTGFAWMKNATWNEMKYGFFAADYEGMACIVSALISNNIFRFGAIKIDNFSF